MDFTKDNNPKKIKHPVKIIVIYEPKYAGNVGSILRTAYQMGYKVVIVGTDISNKWKKTMIRSSMQNMLHTTMPMIIPYLTNDAIGVNAPWYALEIPRNYEGDTPLYNIYKYNPQENHVIVIGSEDTGIPNYVLDMCDVILNIPCDPNINVHCSINVSHALAIAIGVINCKLNIYI